MLNEATSRSLAAVQAILASLGILWGLTMITHKPQAFWIPAIVVLTAAVGGAAALAVLRRKPSAPRLCRAFLLVSIVTLVVTAFIVYTGAIPVSVALQASRPSGPRVDPVLYTVLYTVFWTVILMVWALWTLSAYFQVKSAEAAEKLAKLRAREARAAASAEAAEAASRLAGGARAASRARRG